MVKPGKNITEGNCSGQLDHFLCKCMASNATIDIHLSPGQYQFMHQPCCLLQNQTSIRITGNSSTNTSITCQELFSITFMRVQNVIISNITMVNCSDVVHNVINQTLNTVVPTTHFGSHSKYAIMFYDAKDVNITEFTMLNTSGYGIVAINAIGNIAISKFHLENTTSCKNDSNYNHKDSTANSICSENGILMLYHDNVELVNNSVSEASTTLIVDQSNFTGNKNFLSYKQLHTLINALKNHTQTSIPLHGAGSIAIFYFQSCYDVNATIKNTLFHNNNGKLGAAIAIASFSTTRGKTLIYNCLFDDNNRISTSSATSSDNKFSTGGISYYYLSLVNKPSVRKLIANDLNKTEIITVIRCNFNKLGGTLGAAFHIEKTSVDSRSLVVKIEQCNFLENEANAGSAVYAVNHRFDSMPSNGLTINLININATNNTLTPGSTIQHFSGDFITGVFYAKACHIKLDCNVQCNFLNNQPSVFCGRFASLIISGKAIFLNNTGQYGGGLQLVDTVTYIHQGSQLYFSKNHATVAGGAIQIQFSFTNIQSEDICPIQFIGSNNATPIFSIDKINKTIVNVTFQSNTARSLSTLESIYADVFYVCNWSPKSLIQIELGKSAEVINGTRKSVYRKIFNFIPNNTVNQQLSILAYLPCPCDENDTYDANYCMTADLNNTIELRTTVIVGRSFTINFIALDVVGSIGYLSDLYSRVSSLGTTGNNLMLPKKQLSRPFSIVNRTCTYIDFIVYASQLPVPKAGMLHLHYHKIMTIMCVLISVINVPLDFTSKK